MTVGKGEAKKEFHVRKDMICAKSEFFKAACNPQWESGKINTVNLEEDNETIFGTFLTWVTTRDIEDAVDLVEVSEDTDNSELRKSSMERRYDQLVQCFILGDLLQAAAFQNDAMDTIILLSKDYNDEFTGLLGVRPRMCHRVGLTSLRVNKYLWISLSWVETREQNTNKALKHNYNAFRDMQRFPPVIPYRRNG